MPDKYRVSVPVVVTVAAESEVAAKLIASDWVGACLPCEDDDEHRILIGHPAVKWKVNEEADNA